MQLLQLCWNTGRVFSITMFFFVQTFVQVPQEILSSEMKSFIASQIVQ
jgi:hypothetical protein